MIGQERQIIIIIGSMYIPVSWLNYLCNNFFSIFLAQYFCTFLHSWLVLYFFLFYFVPLSSNVFLSYPFLACFFYPPLLADLFGTWYLERTII